MATLLAPLATANEGELGASLTSLVTVSLSRHQQYEVLSKTDLRAALALEADKQVVGCDPKQHSCLAEIAGAMGANLVVSGSLSRLGETLLLTLNLYDARAARSRGRVIIKAKTIESLSEQIDGNVEALLQQHRPQYKQKRRLLVLDVQVPKGFSLQQPAQPQVTKDAPVSPTPAPHRMTTPQVVIPKPQYPPGVTEDAMRPLLRLDEVAKAVRCYQRALPRALRSEQRYLSWVDADKGPSCQERYISYGLYAPYNDAITACAKAATETSREPRLAKAMHAIAVFSKKFWPQLVEAERYYHEEDYLDDGCTQAKKMHPKLIAGFKRLHTLTNRATLAIDAVLKKRLTNLADEPSENRRQLITLLGLLAQMAAVSPLWLEQTWNPDKKFLPLLQEVLVQWKKVKKIEPPQEQIPNNIWQSVILRLQTPIGKLKKRGRLYRDLEAWKKDQKTHRRNQFDPEGLREMIYETILDLQNPGPIP